MLEYILFWLARELSEFIWMAGIVLLVILLIALRLGYNYVKFRLRRRP